MADQNANRDGNRTPSLLVSDSTGAETRQIRSTVSNPNALPVEVVSTAQTSSYAQKVTTSGSVTYVAIAVPGTAQSAAAWQVKKIDDTTGTITTWADGDANFDNIATDLTALTYS